MEHQLCLVNLYGNESLKAIEGDQGRVGGDKFWGGFQQVVAQHGLQVCLCHLALK